MNSASGSNQCARAGGLTSRQVCLNRRHRDHSNLPALQTHSGGMTRQCLTSDVGVLQVSIVISAFVPETNPKIRTTMKNQKTTG